MTSQIFKPADYSKADGVWSLTLPSWEHFFDYIRKDMINYPNYIWRGQGNSEWTLKSSLDRELDAHPASERQRLTEIHLRNFKFSARGRRGNNPPNIIEENGWWALGQHQGLKTPLLDWTESPFVALYFAFFEPYPPDQVPFRTLWALRPPQHKYDEIVDTVAAASAAGDKSAVAVYYPFQDENSRLVNQAGIFTRAPIGETVDGWVRAKYKGQQVCALIKITIPNSEGQRDACLKSLNRMNVNHQTLFPDLFGSAQYCNTWLRIKNYA